MDTMQINFSGESIKVKITLGLINALEEYYGPLPAILEKMKDKKFTFSQQVDVLKTVAVQNGYEITDRNIEQQVMTDGSASITRECLRLLAVLVGGIKALSFFIPAEQEAGTESGLGKPGV